MGAVPKGIYERAKKGRKWTKAQKAAASDRALGRARGLTTTQQATVLMIKARGLVLARIRRGDNPGELELLVLQAYAVLAEKVS